MPESSGREVQNARQHNNAPVNRSEYSKAYRIKNREKIREYQHEWHIKNKDRVIKKATTWNRVNVDRRKEIRHAWDANHPEQKIKINKNYRLEKKRKVIAKYSHNKNNCVCCGETMLVALTIDHLEGNGSKHRATINISGGHNFYSWLIKNEFPAGYQVLCFNCNISKAQLGFCPHKSTIAPL